MELFTGFYIGVQSYRAVMNSCQLELPWRMIHGANVGGYLRTTHSYVWRYM